MTIFILSVITIRTTTIFLKKYKTLDNRRIVAFYFLVFFITWRLEKVLFPLSFGTNKPFLPKM